MEHNNKEYVSHENRASGVAWSALILSLVALVFAWTSFNRAGQDVGDTVQEQISEAIQNLEQRLQNQETENGVNTTPQMQN